jgi:hypothetical protein
MKGKMNEFSTKGSIWRKWDLQVQPIKKSIGKFIQESKNNDDLYRKLY